MNLGHLMKLPRMQSLRQTAISADGWEFQLDVKFGNGLPGTEGKHVHADCQYWLT